MGARRRRPQARAARLPPQRAASRRARSPARCAGRRAARACVTPAARPPAAAASSSVRCRCGGSGGDHQAEVGDVRLAGCGSRTSESRPTSSPSARRRDARVGMASQRADVAPLVGDAAPRASASSQPSCSAPTALAAPRARRVAGRPRRTASRSLDQDPGPAPPRVARGGAGVRRRRTSTAQRRRRRGCGAASGRRRSRAA